jgi:MFS transporter, LPLT family, lysophospholipid transporter
MSTSLAGSPTINTNAQSRTFFLVIAVQFISTAADNALLIVAIARVIELQQQAWIIPVLKLSLTFCYVLLAPFVGPFADYLPKGRVMLLANFLKAAAVCGLLLGTDPTLALALAGLAAAIYAPAKYGLITELLPASQLVRANGFFEGVTVSAVVLGTALGGFLISPLLLARVMPEWLLLLPLAGTELSAGMFTLLALYLVAAMLNFWVADSGARYASHSIHPIRMIRRFFQENRVLWTDTLGGLSMAITTLLWGVGATLQLIVLRWANEALGLPLAQSAYLQGITALGVVAGAVLASRYVQLSSAIKLLPIGVLIGLLVPLMLMIGSVIWACILLLVVGALASYFVVPMNALLQHRGHHLLTAGRSIAVQGFNENGGILLMLALYAAATANQIPLQTLIICFGALITVTMALVWFVQRHIPTAKVTLPFH